MRILFFVLSAGLWLGSGFAQTQEEWDAQNVMRSNVSAVFQRVDDAKYSDYSLYEAFETLKTIEHPSARAGEALLYHFERDDTAGAKKQLNVLSEKAVAGGHVDTLSDPLDVGDYDGSDLSLAQNLIELAGLRRPFSPWGAKDPGFALPCGFFKRHPMVGQLTFGNTVNHRNDRPIFPIDCYGILATESLPAVNAFWQLGRSISRDAADCGTIYRDRAAGLRINFQAILYRPQTAVFLEYEGEGELVDSTLYTWALTGRSNYRTYLKLEEHYNRARYELAEYYVTVFGLTEDEAWKIAAPALLSQLLGARFGEGVTPVQVDSLNANRDLRARILRGDVIRAEELPAPEDLRKVPDFEVEPYDSPQLYIPKSGWPEPLVHLAIAQPQTLAAFLSRGYKADTRDALGKTTLMAAAQDNNLAAVKALLAAGAEINAVSTHPEDIPTNSIDENGDPQYRCTGAYIVTTGARSPLMYALLEADDALVRHLIEAGADLHASDSRGNSVADYVRGDGPAPVSRNLSEDFKIELIALISG